MHIFILESSAEGDVVPAIEKVKVIGIASVLMHTI